MKHQTYLLFLILFLTGNLLHSQITFPIDIHNEQFVETCSGFFVDSSGGDSLSHYMPNEDYRVTFVSSNPDKPHLRMHFEFFQLGEGDTLFVYDGGDANAPLLQAAVNQQLSEQTIYSSGDSLHFHFTSSDFDLGNNNKAKDNGDNGDDDNGDGDNGDDDNGNDDNDLDTRLGWRAAISCKTLCGLLVVDIVDVTPNTIDFRRCPDTEMTHSFQANAYYIAENIDSNPDDFTYTWIIRGNTLTGQQIDYTAAFDPGAYPVSVTATDDVQGCEVVDYEVLLVGTYPTFNGTNLETDTVCAEEPFRLEGVVQTTLWTGFQTSVVEDPPFFINTGRSYSSTLTFDVFGDRVITDPEDIEMVCITIEHEEYRDLSFYLRSPDNILIQLKSTGGAENPDIYDLVNLGEPVVNIDDIPGTGYEYCFSPLPNYGTMFETTPRQHEYLDNAGNYYAVAYYMPTDGMYTPDERFDVFAEEESPMDGDWRFYVEDETDNTSGHIFSWRILFNEEFYPDTLIFRPEIVDERWYHNNTPINGNPATYQLPDPGIMPQEHEFLFEVTDNFGCKYDTLLTITVLPLPKAEIISDHELPVCEGDSTIFTVWPIDDDGFNWLYQWQVAAGDLEGSIYDTLHVKEPALYTVMITDTTYVSRGCFDFFEKEFEVQNCDMWVPNVFTPNGDGINDEFVIQIGEKGQFVETFIPQLNIVIFNRHGRRVFQHNDYYNNWWDGGNVPDGTYFYVIQYAREGQVKYMEGAVTVLR